MELAKFIYQRKQAATVKLHGQMSMQSNFMQRVLQSLMNMSLLDKCLSMDSHAMGVGTSHNESIASRVQRSYSTPKGEHSFLFQTNLSRYKQIFISGSIWEKKFTSCKSSYCFKNKTSLTLTVHFYSQISKSRIIKCHILTYQY